MVALSRELIVLFSVLTTAVFLWRFIRDKNMTAISFAKLVPSGKILLAVVVPVVAVLLSANAAGIDLMIAAPFFAGAAFLAFFLSQIGLPPFLRGLVLVGAAVTMSCFLPKESFALPAEAAITGLIAWKCLENLLLDDSSEVQDFLPPFLYLSGMYMLNVNDSVSMVAQHQNLVLASLIVAIFMRWIQDPFLKEDKLYVKRIALAVTGGLFLLVMVTKMIVALELAKYAAILGGGFFLTYLLQATDKACESDAPAHKCFKQLLFIGIFTLLASRLFFTPGMIVLAISTLIATKPGAARIAGLYWGGYVFLQCFIQQYNSNMTGINVLHPYTSAALYAGFLIAITATLLLRQKMDNRARAILFVSAGLIAPAATNYFLHAEPTASLLLAALIGTTMMAVFIPAFEAEQAKSRETLMLLPLQLISTSMIASELLSKGSESDTQQRVIALVVLSVVSTVLLGIASRLSRRADGAGSGSSGSDSDTLTPPTPPEQPAEA